VVRSNVSQRCITPPESTPSSLRGPFNAICNQINAMVNGPLAQGFGIQGEDPFTVFVPGKNGKLGRVKHINKSVRADCGLLPTVTGSGPIITDILIDAARHTFGANRVSVGSLLTIESADAWIDVSTTGNVVDIGFNGAQAEDSTLPAAGDFLAALDIDEKGLVVDAEGGTFVGDNWITVSVNAGHQVSITHGTDAEFAHYGASKANSFISQVGYDGAHHLTSVTESILTVNSDGHPAAKDGWLELTQVGGLGGDLYLNHEYPKAGTHFSTVTDIDVDAMGHVYMVNGTRIHPDT
jgi:hypothetical protein